jgi:hypothetical protein
LQFSVLNSPKDYATLMLPLPTPIRKAFPAHFNFPVSTSVLLLTVIRRKAASDTTQLALPPVICAFGLLEDLDPITLPENKVAFPLPSKII